MKDVYNKSSKVREESVVRIMLRDEYERINSMENNYQKEIDKYPKGNLYSIKRGNASYIYLSFRENGKPKSKYIGKEGSEKCEQMKQLIRVRKHFEEILKKIEFEKKEIELYLKTGNKLYKER